MNSFELNEISRRINILAIIVIINLGLLGHIITIVVYLKKRNRLNSAHVFLFCLAIVDSMFLVIHFFEDTLRTIQNVYLNENILKRNSFLKRLIRLINITDRYDLACIIVNYLRYTLRFISAYIILVFTIQRLVVVLSSPFKNRFKGKKSAWVTVIIISIVSFLINFWVFFLFKIKVENEEKYCDVDVVYINIYFPITVTYIILIMVIPITVIFICNILIVFKTKKADLERKNLQVAFKSTLTERKNQSKKQTVVRSPVRQSDRKHETQLMSKKRKTQISSFVYRRKLKNLANNSNANKVTKMLLIVSFSYAILNLPYMCTWSMFFIRSAFKPGDQSQATYLFALLQISEIFYILNYGCYFYMNYVSSSMFRQKVNKLFKK